MGNNQETFRMLRNALVSLTSLRQEKSISDSYFRIEKAIRRGDIQLDDLLLFRDRAQSLNFDPRSRRLLNLKGLV